MSCFQSSSFGPSPGLPPSRPAIAYYTYNNSTDFPEFNADDPSKVLGRAAIAPFFYRYGVSVNASAPYALPQFYDNTLFFFDWFRCVHDKKSTVYRREERLLKTILECGCQNSYFSASLLKPSSVDALSVDLLSMAFLFDFRLLKRTARAS
jgi:hypothetical protein